MSTETKKMDAFEALTLAGFADELGEPSGSYNGRTHVNTVKHMTLDICVAMLTQFPKPYDFNAEIETSIIFVFCDSCAEFPEDVSKQLEALVKEYGADTWISMGNEWEYLWWNSKTGFEGFLKFVQEIDSFAARLPKVPSVVTFGSESKAES